MIKKSKEFMRLVKSILYAMIGINDYDLYRKHHHLKHPGQKEMNYVEYFRYREKTRYSGKQNGCC